MLTVARSVLEQLDTEQVLSRVLDAACELTGARYAALGVLDDSRDQLGRFLTRGIDEDERRAIGALPTGRGVLGELIRNPEPLRAPDVGSHPYSYGFPVGHPPMSSFLGVPILIRGEPYGNLYLTEKQGASEFTEDDEQAAVLLADFAGVAIDHASRFMNSELQRAQLQQTVDALDATLQIARAVGGETDLGAILSLVAKRGRALVSARVLVIELLSGNDLEMAAAAGEVPAGLLGRRVALENTVASAALRSGQTQRLSDRLMRARFEQYGVGQLGLTAGDGLIVPLVFRSRPYGVLVALDNLGRGEFSPEQQLLLESFAASAATAVATAQSAADERRRQRVAAAEAERGRWARELHDETLQALGKLAPDSVQLATAWGPRDAGDGSRRGARAARPRHHDPPGPHHGAPPGGAGPARAGACAPRAHRPYAPCRDGGRRRGRPQLRKWTRIRAARRRPRDRGVPDSSGSPHQRRQAWRCGARERVGD
ncbi:MAG: GAF domain-containing protein [Solirubrobacteraceae bacterium]